MSRRLRRWLILSGAVLSLAAALAVTAVLVARSGWLRENVRRRILAEAEKATGGRVEIGSFDFEWRTLTARVNNFVIHGTEPAGSPPLVRAQSVTVVLKIVSFLKQMVDLQAVEVRRPEASLLIYPDGSTNIPEPKAAPRSGKTPVETILDLAVGRFTVENGTFAVNSQKNPWHAAGENLRVKATFNPRRPSYHGDISVQPLHLQVSKNLPVDMGVTASLELEKNRLTVSSARIQTPQSLAELSGTLRDFLSPQYALQYQARLSLAELVRTLRFRSRAEGTISIAGTASFRDFGHYVFTGNLHSGALSFGQGSLHLRDVRADSAFRMDPEKIDLSGFRLAALGGNFQGRARIEKFDRFRLEGGAARFDLRRLAETFTGQSVPWDGSMSGPVEVTGLLSELNAGRFDARAQLTLSPVAQSVPVHGLIDATYHGSDGSVDLGRSFLQLPTTRVDFAGSIGRQLRVHLQSTNLDDLSPAVRAVSSGAFRTLPLQFQNGSAVFDGAVAGPLASPYVTGHVALENFVYAEEKVDSFAADVALQKSGLRVQNGLLASSDLRARFSVAIPLRDWKVDNAGPLSATLSLAGADVHDLLAAAGSENVPATGTASASIELSGTVRDPLVKGSVAVTKGSFYGEPFNSLKAQVGYLNPLVTVTQAQLDAGPSRLNFEATYRHAADNFENGRLDFQVATTGVPLEQLQPARQRQLSGTIQLSAKGSANISKAAFQLAGLEADITGQGIVVAQKAVGAVHLTARTEGSVLKAHFESAIANSAIRADGEWRLANDYPGSMRVTFTKLDLAALQSWLALPASPFQLAGSVEGDATVSGPALKPEAWAATLVIPQFEITPLPGDIAGGNRQALTLRNQGPVRLGMQNSVIRVESARLAAQNTDVTITGTISLRERNPLDLRLKGAINLTILEDFNPDLVASGGLIADAAVRGTLMQPLVNGRLELKDANLNLATVSNGLSNANGVILFTGNRATIQDLVGESGGGKIAVSGFASYTPNGATLRLDLTASHVRVRYPEGVSTVADAKLAWTGTSQRSLLSGNVTILRMGLTPRTDFSSILALSAQPVRTPAAKTGLLAGMNFDVQIESAPNVLVESALAQQIQAEASLRLRGTFTNPALLGRINVTQGQLMFFGNKYTISQGSISFFNPVRIEPSVNVDLHTRARGVDVTLTLSGPINKMNVSYRSDPPLQFADIVALLATGRTPSTDLSLAARQSGTEQTWQQAGASTLVGQAIANPVAGRLQRFFGVSRIKIDPTFTGIDNPQARLTVEQQVTPDVTFTYITNVTRSDPQIVQVEWALNKRWSVVALREENGMFGLDFYYKKRFK
ncbi:MAG TPA: translocation/assembly module TamB domain-containing protein [Bryobacteraceae bacterium]|nr:translocation/assembly module TamB domain-containing protein [Bryobacteraceae bacterium]